jgi:transcription-repair coupling factor (superfamily II helicase)
VEGPSTRQTILEAFDAGRSIRLSGLGGSSPAWMVASLLSELEGPLLWVCPDSAAAERALAELKYYAAEDARPFELYPDWDVTPYKGYSPSAGVTRRRLGALHRLRTEPSVVVAPVLALLKRVPGPEALEAITETLQVGQDVDRDALLLRLVERGYLATDLCGEPGSFAVRGGILDIWAPSYPTPFRVEFWGDEVDSIRSFDPWTQRSIESLLQAVVLPAREEVLTEAVIEGLPAALKRLADERGLPPKARIAVQRELADHRVLQELELFLPLIEPRLGTVFDHLGPGGAVIWDGPGAIEASLLGALSTLEGRWSAERGMERLVPDPADLFLSEEELHRSVEGRPSLVLAELHEDDGGSIRVEARDNADLRPEILASKDRPEGMLAPLAKKIGAWRADGCEVRLVGSRRQLEQLDALLDAYDLALAGDRGEVARGFRLPAEGLVVLAADEILGPRQRAAAAVRRPAGHQAIGSLGQLNRGDLVVHAIHGIGRFDGLTSIRLDAGAAEVAAEYRARAADPRYVPGSGGRAGSGSSLPKDYLLLGYRGGDRLYLPVHKLDLLSRYVAAGGPKPRLDKLGGQTWSKRRKKVAEEVQKVAAELVELYARREVAVSHAFAPPDDYFGEFAAGFPWEETPDQQAAIDAVLDDMGKPKPMDRLVCGDVGFGKTEVAMRAAFLAIEEGKQVVVLVPTTILALQHYEAFRERMKSFPVLVQMLSRFRTAAENRKTVAALATGNVDIVVGTHRLLSKDVTIKNLGLLVVDEEHRFGVRHKERIKELRAGVDVLTMTATPIPRTLHMALSGIRDFSVITTAPVGRQAVRTSVARFSAKKIHDAIRFELDRGGQIFFVHNRVQTIGRMADYLRKMVPDARIRIAHGQMEEKRLEAIMLDFFQRRFDVLLSSTIIESGIDVPTANTIIINRADHLGLAQLHQLRGRVGRSMESGFCLLLVPPGRALRRIALERLRVIQDNSDLGSGHRIAQHDLELRGAGNLLGRKQSGHIADVGLVTYMELLERAVRKLRGQKDESGPEPEVELKADAWIPSDYIDDERDRLTEYKRLCDARSVDELRDHLDDLTDRYGRPPTEVLAFERLIEVKVLCRELRIVSLRTVRGGRLQVTFDPTTPVDPVALMARVERDSRRLSFRPEGVLLVSMDAEERPTPVEVAMRELEALRGCVAAPEPPPTEVAPDEPAPGA